MANWQTKKLGETLTIRHGRNQREVEIHDGAYPILGTGGQIGRTNTYLYDKPSVLIGRKGTIDKPRYMDTPFWTVDTLFYSEIEPENSPKFLYYVFKTINWQRYNEASGVPSLSASTISSIKINIPEKPEQERIVGVLEVWDEYIEKLEQKIALKEQLKKGLMQQLLTGKRRFSGFRGEWDTVSLSKFGYARTSSVDKLSVDGEQSVNLLNYMDVYRRDRISSTDTFQIVTAKDAQIVTSDLKKGDVLFTPSSETSTDIGHSAVIVEDLNMTVFSYHLVRFRMEVGYLSVNFSAYCFKTEAFYKELWKRAQGATRFTLSKEAIESAKITIPVDIDEQNAIASVIETADNEIESLRLMLHQIKLQKKYLLKNLITGAIRTPEDLQPLDTSRLERSAL